MQIKLYQSFKYVKTFIDKTEFINHLNNTSVVPILQFIISGEHAEELCNLVQRKSEKYDIYELDVKLTRTIRKSSSTWFTFVTIDELFKTIFKNLKGRHDTVDENEGQSDESEGQSDENKRGYKSFLPPLGTFNSSSIPTSFHFLDKESSTFLLFQLLSKTIIQMKHEKNDKMKELAIICFFCREKYKYNDAQMKHIASFQCNYCPDKAIEYYTKYTFLFRSLTEVFQRENTIGIYKFRYYIADLHKQLEKQRCTCSDDDIILYRGKKIPFIVLQQLKDLEKRIGETDKFISMNGFLSTTKDEKVAESFAGINENRAGYESAIFKLRINKAIATKICYADITPVSGIPDEKEVLFSVNSVWKLLKIENNNRLWTIELELSDKFDDQLSELDKKLLDSHSFLSEPSDDYYIFLLAKILYKLGIYSQAEEFYNCLLEKKDLSPEFKSLINLNFATMQSEQGQFSRALVHLTEALASYELETISLRPNHAITTMPSRMIILNVMGLLYQKKDDYDKARHSFKDALEKPGTSIEKAIVYNNLGILEILLGNMSSEVHEYFKKAVKLAENSVWSNKFKQDLENVERQLKKNKLKNQNGTNLSPNEVNFS